MMPGDVKGCRLSLFHGRRRSLIQHTCVCVGGLLAPGPSKGAQSLVGKFYVPRETIAASNDSEVYTRPTARWTRLCIDVLTFMLFKRLKTGLIILALQKKNSFAARTVKTKCTDDL